MIQVVGDPLIVSKDCSQGLSQRLSQPDPGSFLLLKDLTGSCKVFGNFLPHSRFHLPKELYWMTISRN